MMQELHILDDTPLEAMIKKLTMGVRDAKVEVARVHFVLNLKIIELELKLQTSTLLEVREQCKATVRNGVATVDAMVVGCLMLFEQAMEVVTTLHEDPNL